MSDLGDGDEEQQPELARWWVDATFDDMSQRQQFLDKVACGTTSFNAGIEVGWTPAETKRIISEPDFAELIDYAREVADGNIEKKLHDIAARGNLGAIQMWLFNRKPNLWKDVKRIEIRQDTTVHVGVVHSVKASAIELMRDHTVADLQKLAIETTAGE